MLRMTKIETGLVQGYPATDARITVYKGIPYAASTAGDNRWRPPQPAEPWEGVRKCYEFGAIPNQRVPGADRNAFYSKEWHVDPQIPMGEDCLYLNVWTPAKSADEKLPVMLWIHGGGMQEGYGHEMEFDGERIAARGVILVSICYRLNVFGLLAHPDMQKESPDAPANYALWDQNYAMQWVQRNIAAFGGDPDNVTIFGQSAGGHATAYHLCSPKAKGLFKRCIIMSHGRASSDYPTHVKNFLPHDRSLEEAQALSHKFLTEWLGVSTLEEARKLDPAFVEQQYNVSGIMFVPCVEGIYVPENPTEACVNGHILDDVDIMVGNTADEFPAGVKGDPVEWIRSGFGKYADEYLRIVRGITRCDDTEELRKAADFSTFALGARLTAESFAKNGRDPYYYNFCPYIPGDSAKAFHSSELWFVFETLIRCWRPFDGHHFDLARKMCNYFTNFAKTGDPNGLDADGTPMPKWEKYTKDNLHGMMLGEEIGMETVTDKKMRFLLDICRK